MPKYHKGNIPRPARQPKRKRYIDTPLRERRPSGTTWLVLVLAVAITIFVGLWLAGTSNGPVKQGKLNCTPAEIAANVPCR